MRDRYSILVGLLFVAVIVIAFLNSGGGGGGTLGLDFEPARWPLPEFAVPLAGERPRRGRQRLPGRLQHLAASLPRRCPPHSGLPGPATSGRSGSATSSTAPR